MAGSIIIDNKTSVALNSLGFDLIAGSIRNVLITSAPDLIPLIYESMDSGYMPFICIDTLSGADVERFYRATKRAFLEWRQHNLEPFPEWVELIEKLESDERIKHI